ncbi:MAG: HlyD family efflux transporter periplasmic adaptor subunit [Myxococcales bacterium]|nr:HlyD family efflux transporter periplasmic adaptor subunit [Myxococcales bacterium]
MDDRDSKKRRRALSRWIKRGIPLAVAALLLALIVKAMLPKPVSVDVAVAETAALRVTVDEDGVTRVKDRFVVSAPLTGSLARLELDPGDTVKQGDVVARIVPLTPALLDDRSKQSAEARVAAALAAQRQASAQVERARANQEFVQKSTERERSLAEKGVTARANVDQAELAQRTANAELESAKFGAKVADYEVEVARATLGRLGKKVKPGSEEQLLVKSPVAGRVLKVLHKSEGVVQPGTPLLEVGDPAALEIVVDVLTSDAVDVKPGTPATLGEWGGAPLPARVRIIEPSAFTRLSALGVEEQRVNVVLEPQGPVEPWARLGDGYRVKAEIVTHEKADALQVPASAVFRRDSGWAVFRVEGDVVKLGSVQIGLRTQRRVEVVAGLAPGARVVVHPSDRVSDGVKVMAR